MPLSMLHGFDGPMEIEVRRPVIGIHASERAGEGAPPPKAVHVQNIRDQLRLRVFNVETEQRVSHLFLEILLKTQLIDPLSEKNPWKDHASRYETLRHCGGGRELYDLLRDGWIPAMVFGSGENSPMMVTIGFRAPGNEHDIYMKNFDFTVATSSVDRVRDMSSEEDEIAQKQKAFDLFHSKVQAEFEQCFPSSLTMAFSDVKRSPIDFSSFNIALDRYGDMLRESLSPGALSRLVSYERDFFGSDIFHLEPSVVLPDDFGEIAPLKFESPIEPEAEVSTGVPEGPGVDLIEDGNGEER